MGALPVSSTTVSVLRNPDPNAEDEHYARDPDARVVASSGVRAHFSAAPGQMILAGGQVEELRCLLNTDPCDLTYTDHVRDERTAEEWVVETVRAYTAGPFAGCLTGTVRLVKGAS